MKGQKDEKFTRQQNRYSGKHDVFYFFHKVYPSEIETYFLKQLPNHFANNLFLLFGIIRAPETNYETKSLTNSETHLNPFETDERLETSTI